MVFCTQEMSSFVLVTINIDVNFWCYYSF